MAEVKWIKIATEIFDNKKIRLIESMPDGDALIVVWFKLLMLAGKTNDGGMVYFTKDIPFTDQMLSTYFNKPISTIQLALNTFQRFGMIDIVDELIHVSNWEEYQNIDGLEKIREQTRKRVQRHREIKKLECNATSNVTVTQGNATDIDIDIEKEKDNKYKGAEAPVRSKKTVKTYSEDNSLNEAIKDFIAHRKALKKPMTDKAVDLFLKKLDKMADTSDLKIALINNAIEHGWLSVYPLKDEEKKETGTLVFDIDGFDQSPPFYGMPKEWFENGELVRERIRPVLQKRNDVLYITDDILYSEDEVYKKYLRRKEASNVG
jgi:predicted phage replisome organizer